MVTPLVALIPDYQNLLSHHLEVSEASPISASKMSPLSLVLSLSSESSQDGDEIQEGFAEGSWDLDHRRSCTHRS